MNDFNRFVQLIRALEPALNDVIFVGGWAHRLHRQHSLARIPAYEPLVTLDADVVIATPAPAADDDLGARLEAEGFKATYFGDDKPPAAHYELVDSSGFYAEFLIPLVGGESKRGERDATGRVRGVIATRLRHLELLTVAPWTINLGSVGADPTLPVHVKVPNAAAYVAHKLLVLDRRKPEDRAKDILYIHDTIELFADALTELNALWQGVVRPGLSAKNALLIQKVAQEQFNEVTDLARTASLIATGRNMTPEALVATGSAGLAQILADEHGPWRRL